MSGCTERQVNAGEAKQADTCGMCGKRLSLVLYGKSTKRVPAVVALVYLIGSRSHRSLTSLSLRRHHRPQGVTM